MKPFFARVFHPLSNTERESVSLEIEQTISSTFDFFLLVVLSCAIATLGLITNSPAVIIGAMLVAPLMSPIIGIGLSSITGNARLARKSMITLVGGTVLAVLLSYTLALINTKLPFVLLQNVPSEIMARVNPTPIDLLIALAGGLAAAYAMTRDEINAALPGVAIATALMPPLCTVGIGLALNRTDISGGASLLFITNAITIAFAAATVFFLRGFAPKERIVNYHIPRSLIFAALITSLLLVPLTYYSIQFYKQATENLTINEVVNREVKNINAEILELHTTAIDGGFNMILTIRTTSPLTYEKVTSLQQGIVKGLDKPVTLKVNQVFAEQLDPLIPPTVTSTFTPGPSPTATATSKPPTATATATITSSPTATITATPPSVQIVNIGLPKLQLYQQPAGPVIGQIKIDQILTQLPSEVLLDGLVWVQVIDGEGRVGWLPQMYLNIVTITPTITLTPSN